MFQFFLCSSFTPLALRMFAAEDATSQCFQLLAKMSLGDVKEVISGWWHLKKQKQRKTFIDSSVCFHTLTPPVFRVLWNVNFREHWCRCSLISEPLGFTNNEITVKQVIHPTRGPDLRSAARLCRDPVNPSHFLSHEFYAHDENLSAANRKLTNCAHWKVNKSEVLRQPTVHPLSETVADMTGKVLLSVSARHHCPPTSCANAIKTGRPYSPRVSRVWFKLFEQFQSCESSFLITLTLTSVQLLLTSFQGLSKDLSPQLHQGGSVMLGSYYKIVTLIFHVWTVHGRI